MNFQVKAVEAAVNLWFFDALVTWQDPFPDKLRHVWVLILLTVGKYCFGNSEVLSNFSLQISEYFIDLFLWDENLVVFDTTSFSVMLYKQ